MVKPKVTDLGAGQFGAELDCGLQRAATVQLENAPRAKSIPGAECIANHFRWIDPTAVVLSVGVERGDSGASPGADDGVTGTFMKIMTVKTYSRS